MSDSNTNKNNSGYYNSGDYNSGDYNSGNDNSGSWNSGHCNSGNDNSGNDNSGDYNSGNWNSGISNSGDFNSGDFNSGNCNSGNFNSGFFNSDTPTVRCFNKETGIKREDFPFPDMSGFTFRKYIDGKLVTYGYKAAWVNFWNSISDDRKQEFTNLPNFNPVIFEEITGIKVEANEKIVEHIENQAKLLLEESQKMFKKAEELRKSLKST